MWSSVLFPPLRSAKYSLPHGPQVQELIQTYKPVAVVSGHDHVVTYSSLPQYDTQFLVSGAGSGTSSADGGWNATSDSARTDKPYVKYGSVSMKGGKTWTGA